MHANTTEQPPPDKSETGRRSFIASFLAVMASAVLVLAPVGAGIAVLLDPLLRKRRRVGGAVKIANVESVPEDGTPKSFQVVQERRDAWTLYPPEPVGAVYLRRTEEGKVQAFNASCPHLGCFVNFVEGEFVCPCHDSFFQPNGERINPETCPSPRDLDELAIDEGHLEQGEVWVDFKNFRTGTSEKIPKA